MDVARELHGGEVNDADRVSGVGGVEAHAERVELPVIGEHLKGLLGVVRAVQELDPSVQLPAVGVQDDLKLLRAGVEGEGAEGAAIHALSPGPPAAGISWGTMAMAPFA